jgi:hypothetical protein
MTWRSILHQIFPIGPLKGAQTYLAELEQDPAYRQNTERLERNIPTARKEVNSVIYTHAKDYLALEDKRSDSVISRGQGLLVSQAFLGALLSLGGAISSRTELFVGWTLWLTSAVVIYIVFQTFLLTRCALISTGSIGYPRISSSQLAGVLDATEGEAVATLALRSILNYRRTALLNDWRFLSLQAAQHSLRNTAISLGILVLIVLYLLHNPAPKAPDIALKVDEVEQSLRDAGQRLDQGMNGIRGAVTQIDARRELNAISSNISAMLARLPANPSKESGCIGWEYGQ